MAKMIQVKFTAEDNKSKVIVGRIMAKMEDMTGKTSEELIPKVVNIKRHRVGASDKFAHNIVIGGKINPSIINGMAETVFHFGNSTPIEMKVIHIIEKEA